ncbi:hypothetical protein EG68_09145 [Paragonimus skrjabini miyazakii]|uniref:EGF-like domain-containing protein n=1 Tax=Paragonimus skrjabini miyazakii TaxID=59628 RepID=A0A8S9YRD3_9TREM|nr:hypothetical protein EG68_09145 [Paragonimus skrjabini miyazakii]
MSPYLSIWLLVFWTDCLFGELLQNCDSSHLTLNFSQACSDYNGVVINQRFCVQKNTTVGVDFTNCHLQTFPSEVVRPHILLIFLPGNEIFSDGDVFCDLKQLDYLYVVTTKWFSVSYHRLLDSNISCPGGQISWAEDRVQTLRYRLCRHQLDSCDQKVNVTRCPSYSLCEFNGPDCLTCTCREDYYGHKCMNKKGFPLVSFSTILVGTVLLFSALLWLNRKGERYRRLSD